MIGSLRGKLILWFALFSFALAALSTLLVYLRIGHQIRRDDENLLAERVHSLRIVLSAEAFDPAKLAHELAWKSSFPSPVISYARVTDLTGLPMAETPGMSALLPNSLFPDFRAQSIDSRRYLELRSVPGDPYRAAIAKIEDADHHRGPWIIQVALNRATEDQFLDTFRRKASVILAFGFLLAIAVGWFLVYEGFRPVERLVRASQRIRTSTLNERIDAENLPSELRELATTLNQVLDRLEDSFSRLTRFSADLAHELRTPLGNLRGVAEVALSKSRTPEEYREALGSGLEEYDRLSKMIDSLLFLARAEDPKLQARREEFVVASELADLLDFYEGIASDAGVRLDLDVTPPSLRAHLEKTLFLRAVGNLVLNAVRHTARDGQVVVRAWANGNQLRIEVKDNGCGIGAQHLPRLFDRFYRADPSRTSATGGTGLGLSIVKSIVELHHGQVEIESELGVGTCARLSFPNGADPRTAPT